MGNTQIYSRKRSLGKDRNGALEGLPLYMVILVVVAAVALVALLSWTQDSQGKDLGDIEIDIEEVQDGEDSRVVITAYDTDGNKLEDVTITLEGAGVAEMKKTNSYGQATFNFVPHLTSSQSFGEIQVTAKYTGSLTIEKQDTIPVND